MYLAYPYHDEVLDNDHLITAVVRRTADMIPVKQMWSLEAKVASRNPQSHVYVAYLTLNQEMG